MYPEGPNIYIGPGYNVNALGPGSDGLYDWKHAQDQRERFVGKIATDPGQITLEEFQTWCIGDWKKPHGSYESAARFGSKTIEEHEELEVALVNYIRGPQDEESKKKARKEIVSELGDNIFCYNALAANSTCPVDDTLQIFLYKMSMGIMLFEDGEAKHPIWRERAVSIAISNLIPVTVGDIDKLIDAGFKLTSSPAMNIDMLDSQEDSPADAFRDWSCTGFYAGMLANLAKQQYGYGTELIGQGDYDRKRLEIAETIPYLFLGALYAARCVAGVRFTEVPVVLYEKLTGRISEGLIDNKADRPEHLL